VREPPDALGLSLRFGCGALFGAAAGTAVILSFLPTEPAAIVLAAAAAAALLCGALAMRWGDEFWSWVAEFWR
jgi:hypothetical protein